MKYIIAIPFTSKCTTYLADAGYIGIKLCYRKQDAFMFDTLEQAQAGIEMIRGQEVAHIEEIN